MTDVSFVNDKVDKGDGLSVEGIRNKLEWNWKDPWSWPLPIRAGLASVGLGFGAQWMILRYTRRPFYANLTQFAAVSCVFFAGGYLPMSYREYNLKTRDAIVDHYVQLHPEAFAHLDKRGERKFKDVLMPWHPIRVQQNKRELDVKYKHFQ